MNVTTIDGDTLDLYPGITLTGAMLRDLNLQGIDLSGSSLRECLFNESNLSGANLRSCDLTGGVFFRTDLTGANLTEASLEDCYWNEVIWDDTTVWPDGFDLASSILAWAARRDPEPIAAGPSGLCTPGRTLKRKLGENFIKDSVFVPPHIRTGAVKGADAEELFLRLAALVFQARDSHGPFLTDFDQLGIFDLNASDFDQQAQDDILFTHCFMTLFAAGLRVTRVLDEDCIEVTFNPDVSMRTLVDSAEFRLFVLLYEKLCGYEFEDESTIDNSVDQDFWGEIVWSFVEDLDIDFDLNTAWDGEDRYVGLKPRNTTIDDPKTRVMKAFLRYFFVTYRSYWLPENEEGVSIESDLNDLEYEVYGPAIYTWNVIGVEELTQDSHGVISAVLRPRLDVIQVLRELNYLDEEDSDEDRRDFFSPPYVTRPQAGRFTGHLG
jgi:hypothetical protein